MIRRLVAVGHDASRTGAPATLVALLGWGGRERRVDVTTVLLGDGPLVEDLEAVGPVRTPPPGMATVRQASAVLGRPGWGQRAEAAWLRRVLAPAAHADLVLVSSAAALRAVAQLPAGRPPLVVHLHELGGVLAALGGVEALAAPLAGAALVLVPSEEVATLAARPVADGGLGVAPDRIRHHPAPVMPPSRHPRAPDDGVALVVGCGSVGWRKGTDLFVALADAVGPEVAGRPVHWRWVGGDSGDRTGADVRDEIRLRGLEHRVRLEGEVDDAPARLAAADLLVVTSREDPFPLVAAEAALVGTPVVGFRPGTTLVGQAGHPDRRVDDLDVDGLARQVVEVLSDPGSARRLVADEARAAAAATVPLVAPAIWADLELAAEQGR